jgi:hypothetical protein
MATAMATATVMITTMITITTTSTPNELRQTYRPRLTSGASTF